jgi:hypothetical protein
MMPFIDAAADFLEELEEGTAERAILEYLLANAVGHKNAKTWREIYSHLVRTGKPTCSKNKFQNGLVKQSRATKLFIASHDHPPALGFFIIVTREDAEFMHNFYCTRLAAESANLTKLEGLMEEMEDQWGEGQGWLL